MTPPLWTTRAARPGGGPDLSVHAENTDDGLRLVFTSASGSSVGLTFDRAEVAGLRDALTAHLAEHARRRCPNDHTPRPRSDGRDPWCVYCGCTHDGTQVVNVSNLRGLA